MIIVFFLNAITKFLIINQTMLLVQKNTFPKYITLKERFDMLKYFKEGQIPRDNGLLIWGTKL